MSAPSKTHNYSSSPAFHHKYNFHHRKDHKTCPSYISTCSPFVPVKKSTFSHTCKIKTKSRRSYTHVHVPPIPGMTLLLRRVPLTSRRARSTRPNRSKCLTTLLVLPPVTSTRVMIARRHLIWVRINVLTLIPMITLPVPTVRSPVIATLVPLHIIRTGTRAIPVRRNRSI